MSAGLMLHSAAWSEVGRRRNNEDAVFYSPGSSPSPTQSLARPRAR